MARKRKPVEAAASPALPSAPVIDPNAVFQLASARAVLQLPATTLKREIRAQRLRVSKRGGRYWLLGRWLLEWIERGEVRRPVQDGAPEATVGDP